MVDASLSRLVRVRAANRCEYCLVPQSAFHQTFHVDHIIASIHGGPTTLNNLALACPRRNLKKGPNLTSVDPETGEVVRIFDPRTAQWPEHFALKDQLIVPRTPIGRVTVLALDLNNELRLLIRRALRQNGLYPG